MLITSNWIKEHQQELIDQGRFANYRFKCNDGSLGDYIKDL
jgi:hypothetical protein